MNSKKSTTRQQWKPCDEGLIQSAGDLLRHRRHQESRRQFLRSATIASVAAVGAGFVSWSLLGPADSDLKRLHNNPNYYGGIACSEVQRLMAAYIDDSLQDSAITESITIHLAKCSHCRAIHAKAVKRSAQV